MYVLFTHVCSTIVPENHAQAPCIHVYLCGARANTMLCKAFGCVMSGSRVLIAMN